MLHLFWIHPVSSVTQKSNEMDLEEKYKKETGFESYIFNNLQPKIYDDSYVEWLENQIEKNAKESSPSPCKRIKEEKLVCEDCENSITKRDFSTKICNDCKGHQY